ncbi:MAG: N-acetylglucosamine-6-phosphate deacetylase [Rhizobiaceae bacterium]
MSITKAIIGADIFDGATHHLNSALVVSDGNVLEITTGQKLPDDCEIVRLDGGLIAPGYLDLQVNGGGGVLLNEQPDVDGIRTMCAAHAQFGTTAMLPTLITDRPDITERAIAAGIEAYKHSVPGFIGLHLEGPHLSIAKKGAHAPELIRPMTDDDLNRLIQAKESLPYLMTTVAPEAISNEQISRLSSAGINVSLGHTDTSFVRASSAIEAGARCVTHLYNAMSPLTHRDPGLVGAALVRGDVFAGLIADGYHVDPAAISIALAAKNNPGRIFLVTDAMSTIGTDMTSLTLNGRNIRRENGCLLLEDGTLAGADLDMASAVRFMHSKIGLPADEALKMASLYPAQCIGATGEFGTLKQGSHANFVHLAKDLQIQQVWQNGKSITLNLDEPGV